MVSHEEAVRENEQLRARLIASENRLLRESLDYFDRYVDAQAAVRDRDGTLWSEIGRAGHGPGQQDAPFADETQLAQARSIGRALERTNEFAINGHENRISYIVGTGHTYKAVRRKDHPAPAELVGEVQRVLDAFVRENRWHHRQQELIRRRDRDGEVFLRLFPAADGIVRVRFVEPSQVYRPAELASRPEVSFGIETDADDVETVIHYWIDGEPVPAAEIQHRKTGVDSNVKRGVPLFYPVRHNLRRAEKLLQNMATVADIQTAIAMIRRHDRTATSAAALFRSSAGHSASMTQPSGDARHFQCFAPGTILDAPKSIEYDFPAAGIDASRYVTVLGAILRSVASRLVFPEFMLTSDASNANYSSTLVAEGPAVKMFERWQADMRVDDLNVLHRVIESAIGHGRLPEQAAAAVEIQVGLPHVSVRDRKQEAEVNEIYHRLRIKSPQTIAGEIGLDHDQEQDNLAAHGMRSHESAR